MFNLTINTNGAAFRDEDGNLDPYAYEVGCLLKGTAYHVMNGKRSGNLFDCNGNKVGEWSYNDE